MTPADLTETANRIKTSEACRLYKYFDTNHIATLGWGLNLNRSDLQALLQGAGANAAAVLAAPTATTSRPSDAKPACITQSQADALFAAILPGYITAVSTLLAGGIFDSLLGPRQFVWVDMGYNLGIGDGGLPSFDGTIALLNAAQKAKNAGSPSAHTAFETLADHMQGLAWFGQVGNRSKRDVAMMRSGVWCDPNGDGSDIL